MMETPSVDHSLIVRIAVPAVGAGSTLQCKVPDAKMAEVCDLITATSKKLHEQLEAIGSTFEDETLTDLKEDITTKTAAWKGEVHSTKTATTTSSVEDTSTVKVESYSESELPENAARMVELAIQQASTEFKSKYGQAVANHSRQMSEAQKELERCHRRCRFVMAKLNIQQSDAEIDAAIDSGSHWTRAKVAILMLRNSAKLWTQLRGTPKKIHAETRIPREDLQGGLLSRRGVFGYRKLTKGVQAGRDFSGVFKNSGMRLELPPGSPRPPPAIPPPKEPLPTIPLLKISGDPPQKPEREKREASEERKDEGKASKPAFERASENTSSKAATII
ncbi:hypothetical protein Pmar_PMAR020108 [Perkinsus marinus ATCC 50983]|uniref:Uncharacterized protein n=1 Tax=Perkinsus marinus (strain ATCC 50983 / TXsc) TaxID=423536 RepID=C5KWQ4_PERM5|nr:hypothetical protein Pmar_PMAR020108 [Perkinsus marinus ATCC 50983]EER11129.1 hypothetical protein Pmar_PMAR020108 [Perkinsus marinus ATCC 50983]|eukprot:XP_002779334.1 hypothetical protein Pmar_PMAR020108 [Perkinsus marinus ATCC 50983]